MHKSLSAITLATSLTLGAMSPTTAHASDDDIARFVLGAGLLAVLAAAIDGHQDGRNSYDVHYNAAPRREAPVIVEQPREVHRHVTHKHVTKVIRKPTVIQTPKKVVRRTVVEPPKKTAKQTKVLRHLPAGCEKMVRTSSGRRGFVTRSCLTKSGIRTAPLPNQCERVLDLPGSKKDRRAWSSSCLQRSGYRIR